MVAVPVLPADRDLSWGGQPWVLLGALLPTRASPAEEKHIAAPTPQILPPAQAADLLLSFPQLLSLHQMSGTLREWEEHIPVPGPGVSLWHFPVWMSPDSADPQPLCGPLLEPPWAGSPLTQQDEGDEQHDEDRDAEDECKPPLAHAGSSEHGESWQQGRGRVRGHPEPATHLWAVGEQGHAHPNLPCGHCPFPCPPHPSQPRETPACGDIAASLHPSPS